MQYLVYILHRLSPIIRKVESMQILEIGFHTTKATDKNRKRKSEIGFIDIFKLKKGIVLRIWSPSPDIIFCCYPESSRSLSLILLCPPPGAHPSIVREIDFSWLFFHPLMTHLLPTGTPTNDYSEYPPIP